MRSFDSDTEMRGWLREISVPGGSVSLPDPHVIWKRAEVLRRIVVEQAALRPVKWMELLAAATCAAAGLIVILSR